MKSNSALWFLNGCNKCRPLFSIERADKNRCRLHKHDRRPHRGRLPEAHLDVLLRILVSFQDIAVDEAPDILWSVQAAW